MVTKQHIQLILLDQSLILAKIYMVTKRWATRKTATTRLILAKIHMVTKLIT